MRSVTRNAAIRFLPMYSAALLANPAAGQDQLLLDARLVPVAEIQPAAKDAAAFRALTMLGERLALLPRETGEKEPTPEHIRAMWAMAIGGGGLQVFIDGGDPDEAAVALTSTPAGGTAAVMPLLAEILSEGASMSVDIQEDGTIRLLDTPFPDASVRAQQVEGRDAIVMRVGTDEPAPVGVERFDLLPGTTPIASLRFELGMLFETIEGEIQREQPQVTDFLREMGYFDIPDASISVAVGTTGTTLEGTMRISAAEALLGPLIGDAALTRDAFRVVPRDATSVNASVSSLAWLVPAIEMIGEELDRDFFEFLKDGFGIDLRSGVLENLGPIWITYQSDSTGGGGVMSTVFVCQLRDTDAFLQTMNAAMVHANQFGATLGRGYGRTREWGINGTTAHTLVAAGIPLPFEISWAVADGHLVVAATPSGLIAALEQLDAGSSVLDHPAFAQAVLSNWPEERVTTAAFRDTARHAARGYGTASLLASALANAVRKPMDDFDDPGVLMPGFAAFTEGIRPTGILTTWQDGEMLMRMQADASALVQIASSTAQYGNLAAVYIPAVSAGVMLPAVGKAREAARSAVAASQVRALTMAMAAYEADHGAHAPDAQALIDGGYITPDMLVSQHQPAWDGRGDIVIRTVYPEPMPEGIQYDNMIVAIDRGRYLNWSDQTPVGFADGRVEMLSRWEIDRVLEDEPNAGLREQLMLDE